jgi:hypothetical protein
MNIASYLSSTTFRVAGDRTTTYRKGLQIILYQGYAGNSQVSVVSSVYDTGTGLSTVTIEDGTVAPSLSRVALGPTYSDPANNSGNTGKHFHTGPKDGGFMAASAFSSAQVTNLQTIDIPVDGDAGKVVIVCPTFSDGFQLASLLGTTNRVSISIVDGAVTFTLPQDIHTGASPTLTGLTLTGLTGIMEAKGASAVGIVAATGSLQILRRNALNDSYEFSLVNLNELGDTNLTNVAAGDVLYRNASNKWVNLPKGLDGQALIIDPSTHMPAYGLPTMTLGNLSDVSDTCSPGATGDTYFRDSDGSVKKLAIGTGDQVLGVTSGKPAWKDSPDGVLFTLTMLCS